ncbi:hypothetical protein N7491_004260 [Penicillium cf. griseofulvum]|nr:hypothetical protein N7491_004260 [Penicillium cf. griseofulvum]
MWLWNACWASRLLLLSAASGLASGLSQFQRLELNKNPCPGACDPSGNTTKWFTYHSVDEFAACNEPILLNLNLYTPVDDDSTHTIIRACTLGNAHSKVNFLAASGYVAPDALGATNFGPSSPQRRDDSGSAASLAYGERPAAKSNATAYLTKWKTSDPLSSKATEDVILAAQALQRNLKQEIAIHGKKKIIFTYLHGTLIGLYSGSQVDLMQTSASMLDQLITALEGQDSDSVPSRKTLEICGGHCTASHIFGVVADAGGDFRAVQSIVKSWNDGELLSAKTEVETESIAKSSLWTFASNNATQQHQHRRRSHVRHLNPRAECRSIRVEGKDTCTSLATRCGIGGTAFENFNKGTLNCRSPLQPGQPVCCSSGTLPDVTPDPNPDGSCAFHEVQEGEYCQTIAATYGLTTDDLFDLNKKTWAWDGCDNLLLGLRICVSEGFPPLPASVWNAECGPTVPDTKPPKEGEELAEMNPCPLDVCCNIWGMCGTTVDFCIPSNSTTGNPGTSAPKENGCIANCGMEMVNDDKPPEVYKKIGYFEGWNYNRPCLTMHVDDIDDGYTHIHFAFGEFSSDMEVLIKEDVQEQWKAFKKADRDYKKVLSFGGWEFSNARATSGMFRLAVSPDHRDTFAENVVKFAADNGLDGLDFDWEYPGATDIEGSDPGSEDDGKNYLEFLKLVREKLPQGKSLSVATAASFWYLKGFPVKEMAPVLDYFIHMTYDFHGQWDVGREWSMDGCPAGNCLRSHVNSTLTHESLVMMTKAGVPSHKIVVGVTSYGRSFKMSDPTCRGPMCTFVGERNNSPAKPGRCTDTGGYISNFEILEIIDKGGAIKSWYDEATDSDYLVFNSVEWVAYMTNKTKDRRRDQYKGLNCGGTTDWATDLQGEGRRAKTGDPVYLDPILPSPTTIDPGKYTTSLLYGSTTKTTSNDEVVTVFVTQTTTITLDLPVITTDEVSYSNVNITRRQDASELWVGVSIPIGPVTVSLDDGGGSTTTRVLSLPAWPAVTQGPPIRGDGDDDKEDWEVPNIFPTTAEPEPTTNEPAPTTLPTWRTYPPYVVEPVNDDENDDYDGAGGIITSCKLWFFNICLGGRFKSIRWTLPPGIYPPGPPPPDILGPPGNPKWTIKPTLPPWPTLTVGRDNKLTYSDEPSCQTESAELCSTTVLKSETLVATITSTVAATSAACETVYGCSLKDWESTTATTAPICEPTSSSGGEYQPPAAGCPAPAIVYPKDPENVGSIPSLLQGYKDYVEVGLTTERWVAFYWIPMLGQGTMDALRQSASVSPSPVKVVNQN